MGHLNQEREEERLLAERAADWLRRLETGDADEKAAFMAWLKESPRNVREVLLMTTWDKVLESFDPQKRIELELAPANVVAIGAKPVPANKSTGRTQYLLAACAAALVAGVVLWWSFAPDGKTYATAVGEQRAVELDDGSVIQLNARSRLRVDYSAEAREVHLLEGQALFKVEHDTARPFRVHADRTLIRALGTQFDVNRRTGHVTVAVIEGRVQVQDTKGTEVLGAGEEASIARDGEITRNETVDVAATTAWRQRRLVFRKDSLEDMAAEFNRYNRKPQIRIEGEALRHREFNGVFDADDPHSFVQFLNGVPDLEISASGDEVLVRTR